MELVTMKMNGSAFYFTVMSLKAAQEC